MRTLSLAVGVLLASGFILHHRAAETTRQPAAGMPEWPGYFGSSGDFGPAFLTAIHARTGEIAWQDRTFAKASFLNLGGKAILLDEDGVLALVTLSADGLTVLAKAQVARAVSWTVPTLVGTTLYVRDRVNIMALDLGAR